MLRRRLTLAIAATGTGAAAFASLSVLDRIVTGDRTIRVAMLPSWWVLLALAAAAALMFAVVGGLLRRRSAPPATRLESLVLPLCSLGLLTLPYLPLLPDRWPALQALAGPLVPAVWLVVAALQAWVLWQAAATDPAAVLTPPRPRLVVAIFVATLATSGAVAVRLLPSAVYPGGDEPHYLVIAQSLWRDGDLDIFNNHQRGDYREYFNAELAPHYMNAGVDQGVYSVHPVLMPLLVAPVYAVGGYPGVAALILLAGAATAAVAWWWVRVVLNAAGAATFGWAAIACSAPYLLNAFTVYPEVFGGLCVMSALLLTVRTPWHRPGIGRHVAAGIFCGALPWLSTKYAPMSAALLLVAYARLWRGPAALLREPKAWAMAFPYGASLLAWFAFFYIYWGSPSPTAAYGEHGQTSLLHLLRGAPGLVLDQEYGLLAFAPAYALAGFGLVRMWHTGSELRRQAIEITFIFVALLVTVGSHLLWWGGSAPPGRPLVSGLFLLTLPIAVAFRDAPAGSARRAAHHLLLWLGIAIATTLTFAADGLLIDNGRDGSSALLEYWSPSYQFAATVPSFIKGSLIHACVQALCWLAAATGAGVLLSRWKIFSPGAAALLAITVLVAALSLVVLLMPMLPGASPRQDLSLAARARLVALDRFDSRVRPTALRYDETVQLSDAASLLPYLSLQLSPGLRTERTPVPLFHSGRFSLPAGTYSIAVAFGEHVPAQAMPLSVQVGRTGAPLQSWQVQPQPEEIWRAELALPVDVNFFGLRGPVELERAIERITITPIRLVDAGARPQLPAVIAARNYAGAAAYFHDEHAHPEPQGLWVLGRRTAQFTIVPAPGQTSPVVLRFHSGGEPNTVRMSVPGWEWEAALVAGQVAEVELPPAVAGVIPLTVTTTNGARPSDRDPASKDSRLLGIWVEFKP